MNNAANIETASNVPSCLKRKPRRVTQTSYVYCGDTYYKCRIICSCSNKENRIMTTAECASDTPEKALKKAAAVLCYLHAAEIRIKEELGY
jgi:hypothetical protein